MTPVLMLAGPIGAGKSGLVRRALPALRAAGVTAGGVLQHARHRAGRRIGYDVEDLATGERCRLARRAGLDPDARLVFEPAGVEFGRAALAAGTAGGAGLLVVDEVGPRELAGDLYDEALRRALAGGPAGILLVVREGLIETVRRHYRLPAATPVFRLLPGVRPGRFRLWLLGQLGAGGAVSPGGTTSRAPTPRPS